MININKLTKKIIVTLPLILLVFLSLFLSIYAIDWGIPSEERIRLTFGNKKELKMLLRERSKIREKKEEIYEVRKEEVISYLLFFQMLNYLTQSYVPDETLTLDNIRKIEKLDFKLLSFTGGRFYIYTVTAILKLASIFHLIKLSQNIEYYYFSPQERGKIFIVGRLVNVIFFLLAIYIVFLIGKELYNQRTGIIISLLFVITPALVFENYFLHPHTFALFWALLSLYYSSRILKRGNLLDYILASLFAGLAGGSLLSFGCILLAIPIAHILRQFYQPKKLLDYKFLLSIVFLILGFFVVNPHLFISFNKFIREISIFASWYKFSPSWERWSTYLFITLKYGLGLPLFYLSLYGIFFTLYRRKKEDFFILFLFLSYFIYFASTMPKATGDSLFLFPIFNFFAARSIGEILSYRRTKLIIIPLFGLFVVFYTFCYTFSHLRILGEESSYIEAGKWINNKIKRKTKIGMIFLPTVYDSPPFNFLNYKLVITGWNKYRLDKEKPEYFIITENIVYNTYFLEKIKNFLSEYKEIKRFERIPSFLGLKFKKGEKYPFEWKYLNPRIIIYKRS
jgi:hypothetical protein